MSVLLSFPQQNKSLIIAAFLCISRGVLFCSVDMPSALSFSSVSVQCLGSWSDSIKTSRTRLQPPLRGTRAGKGGTADLNGFIMRDS